MAKKILMTLTIIIGTWFCCYADNSKLDEIDNMSNNSDSIINRIPDASDIDEARIVVNQLKTKFHSKYIGQNSQLVKIYHSPEAKKLTITIYGIVDKVIQDDVCHMLKIIKKDKIKDGKKLIIKFYRKENFVKATSGFLRKDEELLRTQQVE